MKKQEEEKKKKEEEEEEEERGDTTRDAVEVVGMSVGEASSGIMLLLERVGRPWDGEVDAVDCDALCEVFA